MCLTLATYNNAKIKYLIYTFVTIVSHTVYNTVDIFVQASQYLSHSVVPVCEVDPPHPGAPRKRYKRLRDLHYRHATKETNLPTALFRAQPNITCQLCYKLCD